MKYKTVKACFKARGLNPNDLPDVSKCSPKHAEAIINAYILFIVIEAHNEGYEPNWLDSNEPKYNPWFYVKKDDAKLSGAALSFGGCDRWYTRANVGSRLCLKSAELAKHVGETFLPQYDKLFLFN